MTKLRERLIRNPKSFLLIDASGAFFSALMLGVILVYFEDFFGVPSMMLYWLAAIPCLFLLFDLFAYFALPLAQSLRTIGLLNISYCLISLAFIFVHYNTILVPGFIYLFSEVLVVFVIGYFEVHLAKELKK